MISRVELAKEISSIRGEIKTLKESNETLLESKRKSTDCVAARLRLPKAHRG
eukprot:TRINITY_DN7686_c0_g1_i1.p5 TRINITY_DN7686_c0_g1~~TRINITY_DN7686_c0_g1_i1.p5  ORF type:complete len:52 (-),score=22.43 TRINITY_DN7686_c0_g1_i1:2-157(-)